MNRSSLPVSVNTMKKWFESDGKVLQCTLPFQRHAKMCAYSAGNVEHFKYLMKRLGYVFKKDAWMEV